MKFLNFFFLSFFLICTSAAQVDLKYFEKKVQLRIGGGSLHPSAEFASGGEASLFVKNGYQINAGCSYGIYRNIAMGLHLDYNQYGFDLSAFSRQQGNPSVRQLSPFHSTRFGLSALVFFPVKAGKKMVFNFLKFEII
jgi:hypothetical protein